MRTLRIGMAQINPTIGALEANIRLITDALRDAQAEGVQLLVVPELAVSGYPPEDLLLRDDFLAACAGAVERLARTVGGTIVCVGAPTQTMIAPTVCASRLTAPAQAARKSSRRSRSSGG